MEVRGNCCAADPCDKHHLVTVQAEPDDEDEAEDSDGEDFLLKGPRNDLELRRDLLALHPCNLGSDPVGVLHFTGG